MADFKLFIITIIATESSMCLKFEAKNYESLFHKNNKIGQLAKKNVNLCFFVTIEHY